jgi:hypothetical protein
MKLNEFEKTVSVSIDMFQSDHELMKGIAKEHGSTIQTVLKASYKMFLNKWWDIPENEQNSILDRTPFSFAFNRAIRVRVEKELKSYNIEKRENVKEEVAKCLKQVRVKSITLE